MIAFTMPETIPVFDGHNDVLLRLAEQGGNWSSFLERCGEGHLDLPRARAGGLAGGIFAIYTPSVGSPERIDLPDGYRTPLPAAPELEGAQRHTLRLAAGMFRLARESQGEVRVCGSVAEIREAVSRGSLAVAFHIEGAEAIDPDLDALEVFHQAGLRSLGPVWSRANAFGTGVPFDYPGTPDCGPGLSEAGKELVRACNRLGIMVDLSHLNEKGFWDVARISDKPLVASHSNAHAICPVPRNLTDRQLDAIAESHGLVGVNFAVGFLDPGGSKDAGLPLEVMVRHVDHLVERLGTEGVAFGSDFDGATMPAEIGDVSGLQRLVGALRDHGYDDESLRRICFENWLDVLGRTWS
jgi:membrane dipeptidase